MSIILGAKLNLSCGISSSTWRRRRRWRGAHTTRSRQRTPACASRQGASPRLIVAAMRA